MFPTTHDITPPVLDACLTVIRNLLAAGNRILVVSKPHLDCISEICRVFRTAKEQLLFRFTIGADQDGILGYWEPGAPGFDERLLSLEYAFEEGFETSVSVEPMLDANNVDRLVRTLKTFVSDSIWIGKMNGIPHRLRIENDADREQMERIAGAQADDRIAAIYGSLKGEPKVKWKESIKKVVGLEVPTEAGRDE